MITAKNQRNNHRRMAHRSKHNDLDFGDQNQKQLYVHLHQMNTCTKNTYLDPRLFSFSVPRTTHAKEASFAYMWYEG